jgi:hypothetical protein
MPPPPDPARIAVAQIQGAAKRYARGRAGEDEALAELAEITAGRDDGPALLAEAAGILLGGQHQPEQDSQAEAAAGLCVRAGADVSLIAGWQREGERRAERAALPPFGARVI